MEWPWEGPYLEDIAIQIAEKKLHLIDSRKRHLTHDAMSPSNVCVEILTNVMRVEVWAF